MTIDVLSRTDSFRFRVLVSLWEDVKAAVTKKEMSRILHFSRQKNYDIISSILLGEGLIWGLFGVRYADGGGGGHLKFR